MKNEQTGGIDRFKIIAALLVVAIHTAPIASYSTGADFILTRVIARVAVPFFLMVTGYFILPKLMSDRTGSFRSLGRYLKSILTLYGAAILLYLPVNIYARHFEHAGLWDILRMLLFDGTLYHLWYLPATALGIVLMYALGKRLPFRCVCAVSLVLYCLGLLGDSYYGLIREIPFLSSAYDAGFHVFSYTRNGLFYVPVFLLMGMWLRKHAKNRGQYADLLGFILSMTVMIGEALLLRHLGFARHDSMYIALLPCTFFLFRFILSWSVRPSKYLREISTWIYLIHPLMIIAVRGVAKVTGLTAILVDNSLVHYLCVCTGSYAFAQITYWVHGIHKKSSHPTARAWIELDINNLRHNVETLKALLPPGCELMPAVKANAYGHGAVPIAKELNRMDVHSFCVATVCEGIELRKHGIKGDILVMGYTHPQQFSALRRYRLTQTVIDYSYAVELNDFGQKIKVHIGIDTGMHRLGERCENIERIISICHMKYLFVTGVYTHLCADDCDNAENVAFTEEQARQFSTLVRQLHERGYYPKAHILSSYGLLKYQKYGGDYARVGIALYGVLSTGEDAQSCPVDLRPVLSLKTRVASVRDLNPGEHAGYGLAYTAESGVKVAALSIGYADGVPRVLSCGVGSVIINGYMAPIIGRICMDQTLVNVSGIPFVNQGDSATIIGTDREQSISIYEIAKKSGTITNEILSRLGNRLQILIK